MIFRAFAGATLFVAAIAFPSWAAGPVPGPTPPLPGSTATPTSALAQPASAAHGAIVVAVSDDASGAARALALDVYRDADLRPAIDDATARVLAGEAPGADAPPKLKDVADVRATLAKSFPTAPAASPAAGAAAPAGDASARRLLASLGADYHAELVVAVFLDGGRPIARVIRPGNAAFERVELGAALETPDAGPKIVKWPGATILLKGMITPAPPPAPLKPIANIATPPPAAPTERPFYKSAWFWGTVGGVAAAGITVLVLSKTTATSDTTHLTGHVGP